MKRILIICALLISAVSFTKAQGRAMTPEERAAANFDIPLVASLNLTADQKAKLLPVLVTYNKATLEMRDKAREAGGDLDAARIALRPKMFALAEEYEKTAITLLTADQKKAYDTALLAMKESKPGATTVVFRAFMYGF